MPDETYIVSGASLSATADAIRAKGGTSAAIEYGSNGFAAAVAALPSGGGGGGTYQAKTGINPTTSSQTITPDTGYDALSSVQINAIPSQYIVPTGNIAITQNGNNIDVAQYATASVNVSGSSAPDPSKPVKFIDYDGTLLYSYTAAELQVLTALPANPSHTGLTAQGWNYTLAQAKAQVTAIGEAVIGQNYVTSDDKTRIYCHFEEGTLAPYLGICPKGTVTVDWGDNSSTDTLTGTSESTVKNVQHTYAAVGDYVITLTAASGTTFAFYGNSTNWSYILRKGTTTTLGKYQSNAYRSAIYKIELGSSAHIGQYAFYYCYNLISITIPSELTSVALSNTFYYCCNLVGIVLPKNSTTIGASSFYYCYRLESISINPDTISLGGSAFRYCGSLKTIVLSSGTTTLGTYQFANCPALESIIIPSGVTSISDSMLYYCYSLKKVTLLCNVKNITGSSFHSCYSLRNIIIPSTVESIGTSTFNLCYSFSVVTVPSKVTSIGTNAFYNCYAVAEYHMLPTAPPTLTNANTFTGISSDCIIYVPYSEDHSVLNAYKTASIWTNWATQMQEEPQ